MTELLTLTYGVGIMDADYVVQKKESYRDNGKLKQRSLWVCPFYRKWVDMLQRCYSTKKQASCPTYVGCSVCDEWLTFSKFKEWMETQDWEGKQLDKDVLVSGNKIYSPDTCVFVDRKVNMFLTDRGADRGVYMIGVTWNERDKKFMSHCSVNGVWKSLGYFATELEAHKAWLSSKLEQARSLASEQTDPRVAKALIEHYVEYTTRRMLKLPVEHLDEAHIEKLKAKEEGQDKLAQRSGTSTAYGNS